jgi:hypothetical protein
LLRSQRNIKGILAAAVAVLALSAAFASSASASIVAAKFSSSTMKLTTTGVTVKKNGLEPQSCTLSFGHPWLGFTGGSEFFGSNGTNEWTDFSCPSAKAFQFRIVGKASYDTVTWVYFLTISSYNISEFTPWGNYLQNASPAATATWVNGAGATPSKVTFSNPTIGNLIECCSKAISVEGSFTATTEAGGLITLSH